MKIKNPSQYFEIKRKIYTPVKIERIIAKLATIQGKNLKGCIRKNKGSFSYFARIAIIEKLLRDKTLHKNTIDLIKEISIC